MSVVDPDSPQFKSVRKQRQRVIQPVMLQYKNPGKKREFANMINIKALKHKMNRNNLATSFRMSAVGGDTVALPTTYPQTDSLVLELGVQKNKLAYSLGGIIFMPVIAGMIVPNASTGAESLNVRVARVRLDSVAHRGGVTSQHYVHKMCLVSRTRRGRKVRGAEQIIGSSRCRTVYHNTIDFEKLMLLVDNILSKSFLEKKTIEITLKSYK